MRPLRITLLTIAFFQLVLGALFVLAPATADDALGFDLAAPPWANWLFVMMGARFLAFAYGLALAARDPRHNVGWIDAMIVVQAIDWIATLGYLATGDVTIAQVKTAAIAPPVFIAALLWWHPRRCAAAQALGEVPVGGARPR